MSPTKPIKRPLPKAVAAVELPVATEPATTETVVESSPATDASDVVNLHVKMDQVIDLMKAIDWKIWIYLKANNYID